LIGRCYRRLIAPLSGPIKDQDLRIVASVLRLSGPVAAVELAVAFSLVAVAFSQLPIPRGLQLLVAEAVSVREIVLGALKIFVRLAEVFVRPVEVLGGGTMATMEASSVPEIMATMVVVVIVAMVVMVVMVVTTFFPRHLEALGAAAATAIAIATEQTLGCSEESSAGTSEETSGESSAGSFFDIIPTKAHSVFSIVARGARACSMPTPGCLRRAD
jgi:hypothetical protein